MTSHFRFSPSELPPASKREMDFLDTSFFKEHKGDLPAPAKVKALGNESWKKKPVVFDDLGVLVKFGPGVTVAEAQCLWMIKRVFHGKIPVPEVFGWRVEEIDGNDWVFIYMELIRGDTLQSRWDHLNTSDKEVICSELCDILNTLRQLEQDPSDQFIGSINRQHLLDYVFSCKPKGGPFLTIKYFHEWFSSLPWIPFDLPKDFKDPWREFLRDSGEIKFTHADLHRVNIMVSSSSPAHIMAIVDWEQSGWYPDYWEYSKVVYNSGYESEWCENFIAKCLHPDDVVFTFISYTDAMGAV